jgi:protein tyrosine phosphatase (PTP) superfamily phosphohydrolase (DUF442 family)
MKIQPIAFKGMPANYAKIDETVSRSAQPMIDDFQWLKENEQVTDVINFRTMFEPKVDFSESYVVEKLGMKYHSIPSKTKEPSEENIAKFLKIVNDVKEKKGKVHIHCKAGADRTGMYSYIYKAINNIGNPVENEMEWLAKGHNTTLFPDLIGWTKNFLKQIIK